MAGVQPKGDNSVRQYGGASEKNSTNCREKNQSSVEIFLYLPQSLLSPHNVL